MTAMKRIQRHRTKGWRMPEGAIYVGRPSLWGNPYSLADISAAFPEVPIAERPAAAVRLYRRELEDWSLLSDYANVRAFRWGRVERAIHASGANNMGEYAVTALRGYDLVCWCPLNRPCHADVLLEIAA